MRDRFLEAYQDDELLSLRRDVATFETLISEQLATLDSSGLDRLEPAIEDWQAMRQAMTHGEQGKAELARRLAALDEFFNGAVLTLTGYDNVTKLTDQRRKLIETHWKNFDHQTSGITNAQAAMLFGALVSAIRQRVNDPSTLGAIEADFNRIVEKGPPVLKENT